MEHLSEIRTLVNDIDDQLNQVTELTEYEDLSEEAQEMVDTMEQLKDQITTWQESEGWV